MHDIPVGWNRRSAGAPRPPGHNSSRPSSARGEAEPDSRVSIEALSAPFCGALGPRPRRDTSGTGQPWFRSKHSVPRFAEPWALDHVGTRLEPDSRGFDRSIQCPVLRSPQSRPRRDTSGTGQPWFRSEHSACPVLRSPQPRPRRRTSAIQCRRGAGVRRGHDDRACALVARPSPNRTAVGSIRSSSWPMTRTPGPSPSSRSAPTGSGLSPRMLGEGWTPPSNRSDLTAPAYIWHSST
jgi:hypothetical protein